MFNNCKIVIFNFNSSNIYYNKALRIYSSFIFFNVIFICVAYLLSFILSLNLIIRISYTDLIMILYFNITLICVNHFWLYNIFLKLFGDVEEKLRSEVGSNQIFSICHWNLKSISAYNYIKLSLLRACLSTHNFDVIFISETCLDSDTSHEYANPEKSRLHFN